MFRVVTRAGLTALALAGAVVIAGESPALAHERRTVGGFQFVVGWGDEPAYTGFKNSVQITVTEAGTGAPVTDLGDSVKVEVVKGSDKTVVPLVPNFRVGAFGTPGDYRGWLTPTRPGGYLVRVTGAIRGQAIDESFTSSKTTFDDVQDVASSEFPAKDPSTGELAGRIDREVPRVDAVARRAEDQARTARTFAMVGLAIGVLGLVAAVSAIVLARRGGRRAAPEPERAGSRAG